MRVWTASKSSMFFSTSSSSREIQSGTRRTFAALYRGWDIWRRRSSPLLSTFRLRDVGCRPELQHPKLRGGETEIRQKDGLNPVDIPAFCLDPFRGQNPCILAFIHGLEIEPRKIGSRRSAPHLNSCNRCKRLRSVDFTREAPRSTFDDITCLQTRKPSKYCSRALERRTRRRCRASKYGQLVEERARTARTMRARARVS